MTDADQLLLSACEAVKENRLDYALTALRRILERDPEHLLALGMQAGIHADLGMHPRAKADYTRILTHHPDNPLVRVQLAILELQTGEPALAAMTLAPLLDENADPRIRYLAGMALMESGDPASARIQFEKAASALPTHDPLQLDIAAALERLRGRTP